MNSSLESIGIIAGKDGGAVTVKVAKLNHDRRFDVPCGGPFITGGGFWTAGEAQRDPAFAAHQ